MKSKSGSAPKHKPKPGASRQPLRALVIGYGFMGRTHAANVRAHPGLELCGVVDPALPAIEGVPVYADAETALRELRPDIAIVAVHTYLHVPVATLCLGHGCHVLLEKPICLDPAEARILAAKAASAGRRLMVGHCVRFFPAYVRFREICASGCYGRLRLLKLYRFNAEPHWGQWDRPEVRKSWGGALYDLAIHDIDYAASLLGAPDEIANSPLAAGQFGDRYVNALWHYRSGATVAIESGSIFPAGFKLDAGGWASFEKAAVRFSCAGDIFEIITADGVERATLDTGRDGYWRMLDYFAACVRDNADTSLCTTADAIRTIELCQRHLQERPGLPELPSADIIQARNMQALPIGSAL